MSSQDTDQLIIESVHHHYEENDSPYYLAKLGEFFRANNIATPVGVRFSDYLKSRFHGRLDIIQDEQVPAKIAIAPIDLRQRVLGQLSDQSSHPVGNSEVDYTRLPLALIAAFCKLPLPGSQVYFRVVKPFRYQTGTRQPNSDFVEIDERFRPAALANRSVYDLSLDEKRRIFQCIRKWAEANSVELGSLYYDSRSRPVASMGKPSGDGTNALERLISAQDPELRDRFRIPADIASKLMQLP